MKKMHIYEGAVQARWLAETLFRADAIERYAGKDAAYHINNAMDELKLLAAHLGFDLVKREEAPNSTVTILPIDADEEAA